MNSRVLLRSLSLLTLSMILLFVQPVFANNNKIILIILTMDDPRLGVEKDKEKIQELVEEVGSLVSLPVHKHLINTHGLTTAQLRNKVESLPIDANTFVWFHYSGHGHTHDGWPAFNLSDNAASLTGIHNSLGNAGMHLTTFDACNGGSPNAESPVVARSNDGLATNYLRLFRLAKGDARACSSQTGEFSWSSPELGGLFTVSLLQAIRSVAASTEPATWDAVLKKAKVLTTRAARTKNREQVPMFNANVRYSQEREPGMTPTEKPKKVAY